jgi:hypothetical protein
MKFTLPIIASFLALTSATRLCDKLVRVKMDLTSLSSSLSNGTTTRPSLNAAYMSLIDATTIVDGLNQQFTQSLGSIDMASQQLANLDIQTGCWLGWLVDLESGLQQVSATLRSIYSKGAHDFQEGNTEKVKGYGPQLARTAQDALSKLTAAQLTLNKYNRDVLCWTN